MNVLESTIEQQIKSRGHKISRGEKFIECLPDYPQYYISNLGRLWSSKHKKFRLQEIDGKKNEDGNRIGYNFANVVNKDGIRKNVKIHKLVSFYFIPNPNNLKTVNHLDQIKRNNEVSNLEWATLKDNITYTSGYKIFAKDIETGNVMDFNSISEAVRILNVSKFHVKRCLSGEKENYKNYQFRYKEDGLNALQ